MEIGWIKLHRSIINWKYFGKECYLQVWLLMLAEANIEPNFFEGEKLSRGDLIYTRRNSFKKWKKVIPKLTENKLRTIIKNLEASGQIKTKKNKEKQFTVMTIVNYAQYQDAKKGPKIHPLFHPRHEQKFTHPDQKTHPPTATNCERNEYTSKTNKNDHNASLKDEGKKDKFTHPDQKTHPPFDKKVTHKVTLLKEENNSVGEKKVEEILCMSSSFPSKKKLPPATICEDGEKERPKKAEVNKKVPKGTKSVLENNLIELTKKVVNYLNEQAGRKFKVESETNIKLIRPIFKRGATFEDFRMVIDSKVKEWSSGRFSDGKKKRDYLRPSTLFGNKFSKYLEEAEEELSNKNNLNATEKEIEQEIERLRIEKLERQEREDKKKRELHRKEVERIRNLKVDSTVIGNGRFDRDGFCDDNVPF